MMMQKKASKDNGVFVELWNMASNHEAREIFVMVADRVKRNKESLREAKKFRKAGIEGWLKVETIAALRDDVKEVSNKDHDLVVQVHENKLEIELRAESDFNPEYIKNGATKYASKQALCLFLGDGSDKEKIEDLISDSNIEVVGRETFTDDGNKWVIGMIKPSKEYLFHH